MIGTTIGIDIQNQEKKIDSIHLLISKSNYTTGYKDALQALGRARRALDEEEKTVVHIYENNIDNYAKKQTNLDVNKYFKDLYKIDEDYHNSDIHKYIKLKSIT